MALGVLNNISAIYAQNNLANTQASLSKTLQQLSSGSRINSGADDAAGLSLANGLQASATALSQSAKNASEGVDFLQVADGALSQVTSLLNRAVTLATEAGNGTLNSSQTSAANSEYQKILTEINTINNTSEYNGISTFASNATFTAANASDTLTVGYKAGGNASALTFTYTDATGASKTAYIVNSTVTSTVGANSATDLGLGAGLNLVKLAAGGSTLQQLATALNSTAGSTVASVLNNQLVLTGGATLTETTSGVGLTENLMATGQTVSGLKIGDTSNPSRDLFTITNTTALAAGIADVFSVKVGSAAAVNITATMLGKADAASISVTGDQLVAAINTAAGSKVASISGHQLVLNGATLTTGGSGTTGTLTESSVVDSGTKSNASVSIFTSDGTLSTSYNNGANDVVKADTTALSLDGTSLASAAGAQQALTAINAAIATVAANRGTIGANINTLSAVANVMTTQSTNTLAAMNDVSATDYGQATSDMSKFQILSQTGIAALAQANQAQQLITKLLQ